MKKLLLAIFLISLTFLVAMSGCSNPIQENTPNPEVLFTSTHNLESNLNYLINNSNIIHCALYDINIQSTMQLLNQKNAIVITDEDRKTKRGLMHNKFCIFDNKIVWTGSFNPTNNGLNNDNNAIIFFSKRIANIYEQEFQELNNNQFAQGKQTKNNNINNITHYFCPEDNCKDIVINELNNANHSIYFMTFTFTQEEIAQKLIKKHNQNITIMGIVEKERINMEYEQFHFLNKSIQIKPDSSKHTMHHKVFIIDNETTITGSFNPTNNADLNNDENLIIIRNKNITELYLQEFNRLWKT